jgi:hypothetical protein
MESAFGSDFGGVRVHTDGEAGVLNRAINAVAFTTGQDIFFSPGAYNPATSSGRELLSHELTHVVQQGGSRVQGKLILGEPGDQYEQEAEAVARKVGNSPFGSLYRRSACVGSAASVGERESSSEKGEASEQSRRADVVMRFPKDNHSVTPAVPTATEEQAGSQQAMLRFHPENVSFPNTMIGTTAWTPCRIANLGDDRVMLDDLESDKPEFTVDLKNNSIPAQSQAAFRIGFTPRVAGASDALIAAIVPAGSVAYLRARGTGDPPRDKPTPAHPADALTRPTLGPDPRPGDALTRPTLGPDPRPADAVTQPTLGPDPLPPPGNPWYNPAVPFAPPPPPTFLPIQDDAHPPLAPPYHPAPAPPYPDVAALGGIASAVGKELLTDIKSALKPPTWKPIVAPDQANDTIGIGDHVIRSFKVINTADAPTGTTFRWDGGLGIHAPANVEVLATQAEAAKFLVSVQARKAGETRVRAMAWAQQPGGGGEWSADKESQINVTSATVSGVDLTRISHGKAKEDVDPMIVDDTLRVRTSFGGVSKTATDYPVATWISGTGAKLLQPVGKAEWIKPGEAESTFKAVNGGSVDAQIWGRPYQEPGSPSPLKFQIKYVDLKYTDEQKLEGILKVIAHKYGYMVMHQADAIQEVWSAADYVDAPTNDKNVWAIAAELALTAAIGAIGGLVALGVGKAIKALVVTDKVGKAAADAMKDAEDVGKVVADAMKDAAKAGVKMLLPGSVKAADAEDVRNIYFGAQKSIAIDTAKNQEEKFDTEEIVPIKNSRDPIMTAEAIENALEDNYKQASAVQRVKTLDGWGVAQANQAFGKRLDPGPVDPNFSLSTDMAKVLGPKAGPGMTIDEEVYGNISQKGVLGIRLQLDYMDARKPVTIEQAVLQGWSTKLLPLMEDRKIKDIKMPIALIGKVEFGPLKVGRSETGVLWLGNHRDRAVQWLFAKAAAYGRVSGIEDLDTGAFEGLRIIFEEELADKTLTGKLSGR